MPRENLHAAWIAGDGSTGGAGALAAFFPWWSFTKTVLAICALRLVEENRLSLDTPRPGRPYTLRHLLHHTAGVPNYGALAAYREAVARHETPWPRDKLLDVIGRDRLDFPPGAGWNYSNVGYMFVREAIEEATGDAVANALRTMIFGPLGIDDVRFATGPSDFADVFWDELRGYDPRWVYHGCLVGTSSAAAWVLHALVSGAILTAASLDAMLQRYELGGALPGRPWTRCAYGLGLMCGEMGAAKTAIGHSGGGPFGVNAVYHYPDLDMPVTVATFTAGTEEGAAEHAAAAIALSQQQPASR
jgi:CubicO group peptidase (beta-lactamase class C family)